MNKLELQKTANEIRKDIVTAVHSASPVIRVDPLCNDVFTICISKEMKSIQGEGSGQRPFCAVKGS